ncbi:MAG TPA: divalent-cation tolerance protein CutA [Candidatus Krumholzibacteria bacterium]|nr:divalent-cation tolerance protein CutA [Candidatus Krumholzibacteria bacterium]
MRPGRGAFVQVFVAVPSSRQATRIATRLLQLELCACAQTLGPMRSHYRWRGKLQHAREWLLLLKTRTVLLSDVEREIRRLHPHAVPEILAHAVTHGSAAYLDWLQHECASGRVASRRSK